MTYSYNRREIEKYPTLHLILKSKKNNISFNIQMKIISNDISLTQKKFMYIR